jgi:tRNA G46 methylase TrmB
MPEKNFLCCEVHTPGVGALLKRIGDLGLTNIRIVQHDAVEVLDHMLPPASLAGVHIFFPDPWHKARHNKRRLVQPPFLAKLLPRLRAGRLHPLRDGLGAVCAADAGSAVRRANPQLRNTGADQEGLRAAARRLPAADQVREPRPALGHGVWDVVFRKRRPAVRLRRHRQQRRRCQRRAQHGKLLFAPFAASDRLRPPTVNHVFHVRPSLSDEAFKMVRHCATLAQTASRCWPRTTPWARPAWPPVQQALAEQKLPPLVARRGCPSTATRSTRRSPRLMKAQPQAMIQVALFNTTAAFIRKMRRAGYAGTLMNFSVVGIDPLFDQTPRTKAWRATSPPRRWPKACAAAASRATRWRSQKALSTMTDYDVGGFRINLRAGVHDSVRAIDLVTITPDGKVVRGVFSS